MKVHKISKGKFPWCIPKVEYLVFILTADACYISPKHIENIQKLSAPTTKKQLKAILRETGFCRQWIPCYGEITKPLIALTRDSVPEPLRLEPEYLSALSNLKKSILSAPALGIPDYNKPFTLYVHERRGGSLRCFNSNFGTFSASNCLLFSPAGPSSFRSTTFS